MHPTTRDGRKFLDAIKDGITNPSVIDVIDKHLDYKIRTAIGHHYRRDHIGTTLENPKSSTTISSDTGYWIHHQTFNVILMLVNTQLQKAEPPERTIFKKLADLLEAARKVDVKED